eukprot:g5293.t1
MQSSTRSLHRCGFGCRFKFSSKDELPLISRTAIAIVMLVDRLGYCYSNSISSRDIIRCSASIKEQNVKRKRRVRRSKRGNANTKLKQNLLETSDKTVKKKLSNEDLEKMFFDEDFPWRGFIGIRKVECDVETSSDAWKHARSCHETLFRHIMQSHSFLTLSLQIDEDLSDEVQSIIKKRIGDWMALFPKHGYAAFACCNTPWDLPTREEMELIYAESEFAAWCIVHGYVPSCLAISVNNMQRSRNNMLSSPIVVNLDDIISIMELHNRFSFYSKDLIKIYEDKSLSALTQIAELKKVVLSDGDEFAMPGSSLSFTERAILEQHQQLQKTDSFTGFTEEHYDHKIDEKLMSYIHGGIESSIMAHERFEEIHEEVLRKMKQEGKELTHDGSQEDDEMFQQYFKRVSQDITANQTNLFRFCFQKRWKTEEIQLGKLAMNSHCI